MSSCCGLRAIQERDTNNTPTTSYTRGSDLSGSLEGLPRERMARHTQVVNNLTGRGTLQARSPRSLSRTIEQEE
jgi:hypothetical protein